MKRVFLAAAFFVMTIWNFVNAQEGAQFSLLAGPNYAWASGNRSYYESTPKFGFTLGGSIQADLQNKIGFEFQMLYSYNQAKYRFHESDPLYNYSATLTGTQQVSFVDMPIMVSYDMGSGLFSKLKMGFVPSWALSAHTKNTYRAENGSYTYEDDFSGNDDYVFKSSDIAFTVGTELHLLSGLGLDVRYVYGLRSILDEDGGSNNLKVKRSVISAMLMKTF